MTNQELEMIARGVGSTLKEYVGLQLAPISARIAALESRLTQAKDATPGLQLDERIKALEDRPAALGYTGVWDTTRQYQTDQACTHNGGLWIARMATKGVKPGDGMCWQLAVKQAR